MPDRFADIIEHEPTAPRTKLATRVYYAAVALVSVTALYFGVFASSTDEEARKATIEQCQNVNDARARSNQEIRVPLRRFAAKQQAAANALVALMTSVPRPPDQTAEQKALYDRFVNSYRDQAAAAAELKEITLPKPDNCDL